MRNTTLCYLEKDGCYLMLHRVKKKNDINHDKWIGIGGGIEEGETPLDCIIREVREETGYELRSPEYRGILYFYPDTGEDEVIHLFTSKDFSGNQIVCDEGDLVWVKKEEIRDLTIWEGDKLFLDLLDKSTSVFSLSLFYVGDRLVKAILDGKTIVGE